MSPIEEDHELSRNTLKYIILATILIGLPGGILLATLDMVRFLLASPPSILVYCAAYVVNHKGHSRTAALMYALTLVYVSLITSMYGEFFSVNSNPLISLSIALVSIAAFSRHRRDVGLVLMGGIAVMLVYFIRFNTEALNSDLSSTWMVLGAAAFNLFFLSVPAFLITRMNYRRYLKEKQIEASTRRMLSGEKLKGSELFIPALSHELGGPLGNALMLAGSLREQAENWNIPAHSEVLQLFVMLESSIGNVQDVIRRLRQRIISGEAGSIRISLYDLLKTISMSIRIRYPRNAAIVLELSGDTGLGQHEASELAPVIQDILENAFEYAIEPAINLPEGQGRIDILWELSPAIVLMELEPFTGTEAYNFLRSHAADSATMLHLRISDNGPGFAADPQRYLDAPVLKSRQGSSKACMGLYLSRIRLEYHFGGHLHIDSNIGRTVVSILIPWQGDKDAAADTTQEE